MKCKYCGKKLITGSKICVYCGKPVEEEIKREEEEQKKENSILVTAIVIVALFILLGIGILIYKNYANKENKTKDLNNKTIEKTEVVEEKDYDLVEAKELLDKYYFETTSPDLNLFTTEMTSNIKKYISVKNISNESIKTLTCESIDGFDLNESEICTNKQNSSITTDGKMISYSDLNNQYKYLFGKSNELEKQDFDYILSTWKYNINYDAFIRYNIVGGIISGPYYSTYEVKKAVVNNETLIVDVGYIYFTPGVVIEKLGVKYTEEEINSSDFRKQFLEKYLDKLDTYQVVFKIEDNHYIFDSIKKDIST